jgi:hypothetical protein
MKKSVISCEILIVNMVSIERFIWEIQYGSFQLDKSPKTVPIWSASELLETRYPFALQ